MFCCCGKQLAKNLTKSLNYAIFYISIFLFIDKTVMNEFFWTAICSLLKWFCQLHSSWGNLQFNTFHSHVNNERSVIFCHAASSECVLTLTSSVCLVLFCCGYLKLIVIDRVLFSLFRVAMPYFLLVCAWCWEWFTAVLQTQN